MERIEAVWPGLLTLAASIELAPRWDPAPDPSRALDQIEESSSPTKRGGR